MNNKEERLKEEIGRLKNEIKTMQQKIHLIQEENEELVEYNKELEDQSAVFVNMTVTFRRLFATRSYVEVLGIVNEVLLNIIGAGEFELHVLDKRKNCIVLINREGQKYTRSTEDERLITDTLKSGVLFVSDQKRLKEKKAPVACIPLIIDRAVLGIIMVNRLLAQKDVFTQHDKEILELLGTYASAAIYFTKINWIIETEVKGRLREGIFDLTPPTKASMKSIVSSLVKSDTRGLKNEK